MSAAKRRPAVSALAESAGKKALPSAPLRSNRALAREDRASGRASAKGRLEQGSAFPERMKPDSIYSEIDLQHRFLGYDKLNDEIGGYKLSLFAPSRYLKDEAKQLPIYQTHARDPFSQADREKFLVGMMKVNFLKRLESSVESFEITMARTIGKIEDLERKIQNYQNTPSQNPEADELELNLELPEAEGDDDDPMEVGGKFKYRMEHLRLDDWLKDLQKDKQQVSLLHSSAEAVTPERDAKLKELLGVTKPIGMTPINSSSSSERMSIWKAATQPFSIIYFISRRNSKLVDNASTDASAKPKKLQNHTQGNITGWSWTIILGTTI